MSLEYNKYLRAHRQNVIAAYLWLKQILLDLGVSETVGCLDIYNQILAHDLSKDNPDEYYPYDIYFYGPGKSASSTKMFHEAWLSHIHRNEHHWQHWVLIHDDPGESMEAIEMPIKFIIEMICDWFSFSLSSGKIDSIFSYYEERKNHIILHPSSRKMLETVLSVMERRINEKDETGKYTCNLWYEYPEKGKGIL